MRDLTTDIHNCPLFPAPIPRGERGPTLTFLPVSPLLHFDCAVFHQPLQVLIRVPQKYVDGGGGNSSSIVVFIVLYFFGPSV